MLQRGRRSSRRNRPQRARGTAHRRGGFKGAVAHHDGTVANGTASWRFTGPRRFKGAVAHHDGTGGDWSRRHRHDCGLQRGRRSSRRNSVFDSFTEIGTVGGASKGPSLITTEQGHRPRGACARPCWLQRGRRSSRRNRQAAIGLAILCSACASKGPSLITTEQLHASCASDARRRIASKGPSLITTEQSTPRAAVFCSTH